MSTKSDRMREAMRLAGLKQSEVAAKLGVDRRNVSQWVSRGNIPVEYLEPFCQACKIEKHWLEYGETAEQTLLESDPEGALDWERLWSTAMFIHDNLSTDPAEAPKLLKALYNAEVEPDALKR